MSTNQSVVEDIICWIGCLRGDRESLSKVQHALDKVKTASSMFGGKGFRGTSSSSSSSSSSSTEVKPSDVKEKKTEVKPIVKEKKTEVKPSDAKEKKKESTSSSNNYEKKTRVYSDDEMKAIQKASNGHVGGKGLGKGKKRKPSKEHAPEKAKKTKEEKKERKKGGVVRDYSANKFFGELWNIGIYKNHTPAALEEDIKYHLPASEAKMGREALIARIAGDMAHTFKDYYFSKNADVLYLIGRQKKLIKTGPGKGKYRIVGIPEDASTIEDIFPTYSVVNRQKRTEMEQVFFGLGAQICCSFPIPKPIGDRPEGTMAAARVFSPHELKACLSSAYFQHNPLKELEKGMEYQKFPLSKRYIKQSLRQLIPSNSTLKRQEDKKTEASDAKITRHEQRRVPTSDSDSDDTPPSSPVIAPRTRHVPRPTITLIPKPLPTPAPTSSSSSSSSSSSVKQVVKTLADLSRSLAQKECKIPSDRCTKIPTDRCVSTRNSVMEAEYCQHESKGNVCILCVCPNCLQRREQFIIRPELIADFKPSVQTVVPVVNEMPNPPTPPNPFSPTFNSTPPQQQVDSQPLNDLDHSQPQDDTPLFNTSEAFDDIVMPHAE